MKNKRSVQLYETWLGQHVPLVPADVEVKHQRMSAGPFPFLRATYFRWAEMWPRLCPDLNKTPVLLAVGDIHVDNYGLWRDAADRLVWGVNDFDEAFPLPYASDLVRLATSALLAIDEHKLKLSARQTCDEMLAGYTGRLNDGGPPFILEEDNRWLRKLAYGETREPRLFWQKLEKLPTIKRGVPALVRRHLEAALPARNIPYRLVHRIAGLGHLGKPRWVALAEWHGARLAVEAKALTPSACYWAQARAGRKIYYRDILRQAVRAPDPAVRPVGSWLIRRLGPRRARVELAALPDRRDEHRLISAMGAELANVHHGAEPALTKVRQDLRTRPADWLLQAACVMADAVRADWREFRR